MNLFNSTTDTVSSAASTLFGGAKDIADQVNRGWESTKEKAELPDWVKQILKLQEDIGTGGSGGPGGNGGEPKQSKFGGVAIGAFAWVQYQAARMSER